MTYYILAPLQYPEIYSSNFCLNFRDSGKKECAYTDAHPGSYILLVPETGYKVSLLVPWLPSMKYRRGGVKQIVCVA